MNLKHLSSTFIVSAVISVAPQSHAATATNTMTNIVTLADACDIVAIGLDFGISSAPIPASGIIATALQPNSTVGNLVTGNASHPDAGADGGAGNDDELALVTPIGALNGVLTAALTLVVGNVPGVHVACTTTPTSISVTSSGAGATPYQLPTALLGVPAGNFVGRMAGVGGGASAANTVDYNLTFLGTPVNVNTGITGLPALFLGEFAVVLGTIPGTQSGTVVPGFYTDAALAVVEF